VNPTVRKREMKHQSFFCLETLLISSELPNLEFRGVISLLCAAVAGNALDLSDVASSRGNRKQQVVNIVIVQLFRVFNDFTKSDFKSFWDNSEIFKIILKYGDFI
jgi:hypothetical protein